MAVQCMREFCKMTRHAGAAASTKQRSWGAVHVPLLVLRRRTFLYYYIIKTKEGHMCVCIITHLGLGVNYSSYCYARCRCRHQLFDKVPPTGAHTQYGAVRHKLIEHYNSRLRMLTIFIKI